MFLPHLKLHLLLCLSGVLLFYISGNSAVGLSNVHRQISTDDAPKEEKVCVGTNSRMSIPSSRSAHYLNLRDRYTNCTYVDGNLELTWLQEEYLDLTFLQHIREVTGYVLISHVDVRRVVLPALQIIRGRTLFKLNFQHGDEDFALIAALSKMHSLEMPALRDILAGSCGMFKNYNLCHVNTINWEEIITGSGSKFVNIYNFTEPERDCPPCHDSCESGCWGEGAENCQKFSKINCSSECNKGRCFGPKSSECCHSFCIGGCTGPEPSDCLACRNFSDDGVCKQKCPATQRYNPITYSWETNPEAKYNYGSSCVKTCPENFLRDDDTCVRVCSPKQMAVDGECVVCDGPCPKTCKGVDLVHAGNIESFRNCTVIEGSITIVDHSFSGFQQISYPNFTFGPRYPRMHPDRLEVFSTLQEITGFFKVEATHQDFKNLFDFRNLEKIGGSQVTDYVSSLFIFKTSLHSLNLRSLKTINFGSVSVLGNKQLCFAESVNWTRIMKSRVHGAFLEDNRPWEQCKGSRLVCSTQCSLDGCWGLGPSECLSCAHFQWDETCIESCNPKLGIYESTPKLCKNCHHECDSCTGPGPGNCTACKNAKDGPYCVPSCPMSKFKHNGKCSPCHENCVDGCTGPQNNIGPNGCSSCDKAIVKSDGEVERCLEKTETCPDGYYNDWVKLQEQGPLKALIGAAICRKCHSRCKKCNGYGFHEMVCHECAKYKHDGVCEDECPQDYYADEESHRCSRCANECQKQGCTGPSAKQCLSCRNLTTTLQFNCTASKSDRLNFQYALLFVIFVWHKIVQQINK